MNSKSNSKKIIKNKSNSNEKRVEKNSNNKPKTIKDDNVISVKDKLISKNVNNFRHLMENSNSRDENVQWLLGLRTNTRVCNIPFGKDFRRTIPQHLQVLSHSPRNDKNDWSKLKNEYKDEDYKNNKKNYHGCEITPSQCSFENKLRTDCNKIIKKKKLNFKSVKSHDIPYLNKYCSKDDNGYFETVDSFNNNLHTENDINNNNVSLNDLKPFNSSYNANNIPNKNNLCYYSSINDYPIYLPLPKTLKNSIKNSEKLSDLISKPIKYNLIPIEYNNHYRKDKILLKNIDNSDIKESSSFFGRHNTNPTYDDGYKERNINLIRHIIKEDLSQTKLISSYRCNKYMPIQDNRRLVISGSSLFANDYLKNHQTFSNKSLEKRKDELMMLRSHFKEETKKKKKFEKMSLN